MASSDKELEQQLVESGNKLASPPPSVDELLPLLDQVENCLSKVDQSPTKSMQSALAPALKALVADQLFRHSDVDVKVAVASCISEITRITAPDAPYDDDQMKDVFQLIVSSFENLSDKSGRSYSKRTSILETVAKVRSCVVMLDLECDALIIEMFQHFLNTIRDYHPENVFSSMETIMTLVLEESEEISQELLSPLLASVKRGNEEVLPVARKLAEKVLESCANKVKPYLQLAVKSLGISLDDYSDVVASICQVSGLIEQNDALGADENKVEESKPVVATSNETVQAGKEIAVEAGSPEPSEPTNDKSPKSVVSNGVAQTCEEDSLADSSSLKKQDDSNHADRSRSADTSRNAEHDVLNGEKLVNDETKPEEATKIREKKVNSLKLAEPSDSAHVDAEKEDQKPLDEKTHSKDIPRLLHEEPAVAAAVSSENKKEAGTSQPSSPKALEGESVSVASPSESVSLLDETLSKKVGQSKKEGSIKDSEPSPVDVSRKASEGTSDSEAKPNKRSSRKAPAKISKGEKAPGRISNEEKTPTADVSKKLSATPSEAEAKPLKQPSKKVDVSSNNADGSSLNTNEDKKQRSRGKSVSEKNVTKSSTKDDDKVVSSPKSTAKLTKDVHQLETPKIDSKRKRASSNDKISEIQDDDADLVGLRVKVWWPKDRQYYKGKIHSYDAVKKKHTVLYDDGDKEILFLKKEKWEIINDDPMQVEGEEAADPQSPDVPSETPPKKKAKTNTDQSAKQGKVEAIKGGGASSSKSKSAVAKSGQKSKETGKTDKKSMDGSKDDEKAEGDNVSKTKDNTTKLGSKSADFTPKASSTKLKNDDVSTSKSGKSKEEGTKTPKSTKSKQEMVKTGKSKQDTPKVTSNAKNNSPKTGGKSSTNGTGKLKSGSKAKETEDENSTDSGKPQESTKVKSLSSSKGQGSEVKSGKKRRRIYS